MMDEYAKLMMEIDKYFKMDDVQEDNQVISAYTLYNFVNEKFEELRNITINSTFKDEINKANMKTNIIGKIFKKKVNSLDKKCDMVMMQANEDKSEITICFENEYSENHLFVTIYKDRNSDDFYFGYNVDKELVSKHYDTISETFRILEEFVDLLDGPIGILANPITTPMLTPQVFSDSFLDVILDIDERGRVKVYLEINEQVDQNKIFKRDWYNREKIATYVENHKEELLRKIPINVDDLNYATKTIVESKLNTKVKSLVNK